MGRRIRFAERGALRRLLVNAAIGQLVWKIQDFQKRANCGTLLANIILHFYVKWLYKKVLNSSNLEYTIDTIII
jgi:hypothetical protein